jgi:hypothetical protein
MTWAGWIMMGLGVTGMTGLLAWCVAKVLRTPESTEHLHAQTNIDPGDHEPKESEQA